MQQLKCEEQNYIYRISCPWFCLKYKAYIPSADFLLEICFLKNCSSILNLYRLHFSRKLYRYFLDAMREEEGTIKCELIEEKNETLSISPESVTIVETPAVEVPAHLKALSMILLRKTKRKR